MKKISLLTFGLAASMAAVAQQKPNIVYILTDDLGYGDLKCLNKDSQIPTTNMDRLSKEGVIFTNVHSNSAVCTPTRYGILTGRYCFRSTLKKGVLSGYSEPIIEKTRTTAARILQKAGYQTAIIGKWHLGLEWGKLKNAKPVVDSTNKPVPGWDVDYTAPLTDTPNDHGFDYSYIIPASLDMNPYVYIENRKVENPNMRNMAGSNSPRGVFWRKGLASTDFDNTQTLDHFSDKTVDYIKTYKSGKPFFLYVTLPSPHTPWLPGAKFKGMSGAGTYGDYVCHVDDVVGRIVDALDKKGLKENTIVILTSDNGADWKASDKVAFPKHNANYIFKGEKSDIWDGGHHIPFIVRWPNVAKKGSVNEDLICLTDFVATCAELTGQKLQAGEGEDSFSMLSAMKGTSTPSTSRTELVHHSIDGMFALRSKQWKFVDGKGSGGWSKDPNTE
ncbi:MAG: arylsulfatase, partial [Bacteroidota bacterium]|nr:arylsulfatase [Bacteroidota bacterium]